MKNKIAALAIIGLVSIGSTLAQEEVKTEKPMKIEVKEKNGVLELRIITEEGGLPVEQLYTGEEAKKKLAELEAEGIEAEAEVDYEVVMEGEVMKLTVITRENGQEKMEVFEGAEAEAKLKELEAAEKKEEFKMKTRKKKVNEKSFD